MRRTLLKIVPILVAIVLIMGMSACAITPKGETITWNDMTPKQRVFAVMDAYTGQWDSYQSLAANPNITEDTRKMLRIKKTWLARFEQAVTLYKDSYEIIDGQGYVDPVKEAAIIDFLYEIGYSF